MCASPIRRLRSALALLAAGLAVLVLVTGVLFVAPPWTTPPDRAPATDAVVVLSGGEGTRLQPGEDLAARTRAELAVSSEDVGSDPACRPRGRLCFEAEPFATRGEARAVGALAAEHGWESVAVVTSTYHLTRSRVLVGQCFDGETVMVDAGPGERSTRALVQAVAREWVALAAGLTVQRAC